MLYSDFAAPTVSTTADTAGTTANITYNGKASRVLGVWGTVVAQTLTAAQAVKGYALFTGDGVPSPVPNIPVGQWRGAGLAPQGANAADPTFMPIDWQAVAQGTVTVDVRNAASTAAPLAQIGLIYSDGETLPLDFGIFQDPWHLRGIPKLTITATPTSITAITETALGTMTVPPNYTTCVGITALAESNGVKVTAEEFAGVVRYSNTGATVPQFEPAQRWPFFGQLSAGLGAIIDSPGLPLPSLWHPLTFGNAQNAVITPNITLRTAVSNATSFQSFAAFR